MYGRWHIMAMLPFEEAEALNYAASSSPELPAFDKHRSSSQSSWGSSSDESVGARTPPLPPTLPSADQTKLILGDEDAIPSLSWDEEVALEHAKHPLQHLPPPIATLSVPVTSLPPSPPATPKSAPTPTVTLSKPRKLAKPAPPPSPPTREYEEARRGRSRWPRMLWRSEVDGEALEVLEQYHQRAVGGQLPVLERGMSRKEVGRWSRKMEAAGL